MKVVILLATFNGDKYLSELLDSLIGQEFIDFEIFVSDDFSSDDTWSMLGAYSRKHDNICLLQRDKFGSAKKNFFRLLNDVEGDYIFFCDQDDVWFPQKVKVFLDAMMSVENKIGKDRPILVHSDLRVLDAAGRTIAPSFFEFQNVNYRATRFSEILMQNPVTGCACLINRATAVLATRKCNVDKIIMHDWWLALVASAFGEILMLPQAYVGYRQHGENSVGAKKAGWRSTLNRLAKFAQGRDRGRFARAFSSQAEEFSRVFGGEAPREVRNAIDAASKFSHVGVMTRAGLMRRHGLKKNSLLKNMAIAMGFKYF
jgi:glycosyltransferase involved in cell wall biosynthesis